VGLRYLQNGVFTTLPPGHFMRDLFKCHIQRRFKAHRFLFDVFDSVATGQDERDTFANSQTLRTFIKRIISIRRAEMES
jgi:hypothetical protein